MRIVVAGALGEVGRTVSAVLSESGHDIVAVSERAPLPMLDVIDLGAAEALITAGGADAVLNASGRGDRRPSARTGVDATEVLGPAIATTGTPAVLLSTMRVLEGYETDVPEDAPARPTTPYGEANAAGESRWLEVAGPTASVLRIANYFCPPSSSDSPQALLLPWSLVTEAAARGQVIVRSGRQTTREFVSAADVAAAVLRLLDGRPASRVCATVPGWVASLGDLVDATSLGLLRAGLPAPAASFGTEGRALGESARGWLAEQGWRSELSTAEVTDAITQWVTSGVLD